MPDIHDIEKSASEVNPGSRLPEIEIDPDSGFCFGVVTAINKAEEHLAADSHLYCLGDIVHNNDEVARLSAEGLETITHDRLKELSGVKVLLRAHGEPPSTYKTAEERGITLVDATCPVVLKLQERIRDTYRRPDAPQIVIYGKLGHAEVNGLVGQTEGTAIVVESTDDLSKIDFSKPLALYSQTTKSLEGYAAIIEAISAKISPGVAFEHYDTICRQVSRRVPQLRKFASCHDIVVFVAGDKSSNGRILFSHCREVNPRTVMTSNGSDLRPELFASAGSIGICGATSTPRWLMEQVKSRIIEMLS